jgi:protein disulfide-isomerase
LILLALGLIAALAVTVVGLPSARRQAVPIDDPALYMDEEPITDSSALSLFPDVPPSSARPEVAWQTNFDKARGLAVARNLPLLLRFTAEWSVPCRVLDRDVIPNPEVQVALAEKAVPVILDIDDERNRKLTTRFNVREVPSLILVDSDGEVLDRGGLMDSKALVKFLSRFQRARLPSTETTNAPDTGAFVIKDTGDRT